MSRLDRITQIERAHQSARPKRSNPAWVNTHRDLGVTLKEIERLTTEGAKLRLLITTFADDWRYSSDDWAIAGNEEKFLKRVECIYQAAASSSQPGKSDE